MQAAAQLPVDFAASGAPDLAVRPTPVSWEGPTLHLGHERFVLILSRDDPAARQVVPYPGPRPRAAAQSIGATWRCSNRSWTYQASMA